MYKTWHTLYFLLVIIILSLMLLLLGIFSKICVNSQLLGILIGKIMDVKKELRMKVKVITER